MLLKEVCQLPKGNQVKSHVKSFSCKSRAGSHNKQKLHRYKSAGMPQNCYVEKGRIFLLMKAAQAK